MDEVCPGKYLYIMWWYDITGRRGDTGSSVNSGAAGRNSITNESPAHVGYQGSRRAVNRGRGGSAFRGRGGRFQPIFSAPAVQYVQFGMAVNYLYCSL